MKRSLLKKVLCSGLAMVLTVGLCACGGGNGDDTPGGNGGGIGGIGGNNNKADSNAALAKENVYKYREIAIEGLGGKDISISFPATVYRDGMIYMVMQTYDWSISNSEQLKLLTMKQDGSDVKLIDLEQPKTELTPEELNGESNQEGMGGGATVLPMPRATVNDVMMPAVEVEDVPAADVVIEDAEVGDMPVVDIPIEDDFSNVWENSSYGAYAFGTDGKLYANRRYYYEYYGDANYISINKQYVTCWNTDGTVAWETEIGEFNTEEEWVYISHMSVDATGKVNLLLAGDNAYNVQVDATSVSEKKPLQEEIANLFMNYGSIVSRPDGTLLVTYYDENDWSKMYITTYNPSDGTLGEAKTMPTSFSTAGYYTVHGGQVSDLIYSGDDGVYTYNMGDVESTQKMNFINSDLNISNFDNLVELNEKSFLGMFRENYGDIKVGIFTYVAPEDIPDKSVLVLAGNWIGVDLKQRIVEYNRSSGKYRIVVKEYDAYTEEEGWQAGYTMLNNDIITGKMPDILITDGLPTDNYASKGLLADIKALIAKDEELSKVEFTENVFDAYSVKDKLYYIIPGFYVNTLIGKSSVVGDRNTWTMADMQALHKSLPEGTEMFGELTRNYFFDMMMQYCGSDLVDVNTGKCDFNSDYFIEMMEYAKSLPTELDDDYYGEDFWMTYESRYREGRTVLMSMSISDVPSMNYTVNGMFGEDVSYIGFPTASGQGSYVSAINSYALSAKSKHLDAAWDFMRYYLTEEYQKEMGWGLSVHKNLLVENAQKATQRPYYLDENGEKIEYDDYFYMNGEEIKLDPMTQAQVDEVVDFALSVNKRYYNNTEVLNIINEEMGGFFDGKKPARDVAAIIQSRVQLYVDENR